MADVTVVIPHWNRRDLLEPVLDRLKRQTHPVSEILVVDNGSTDGSAELAEAVGARVIRMGTNRGFSAAVNRGISETRTSWIAILNNDVTPELNWLERLLLAADHTDVWFATGKLLRAGNTNLIDGSFDLLCRGGCAWRAGHGRPDGPLWDRPRAIWFAPFTAALFRAELFERVGLLDEDFGSYLEDVDFGLRSAIGGFVGVYEPTAVAMHAGSETLGAWSPAMVRLIARNQLLLTARHLPGGISWPVLVAQSLWGLTALRHGTFLAYLRGKLEGLGLFSSWRKSHTEVAPQRLEELLRESERQLRELQQQTGFDLYWRLYFALTSRGGAEE